MLKFITNMQISRRLLMAFLLAAVIPGIVISILGITFAKRQVEQGQVIQTNIHAFKSATTTGAYLPQINYLLNKIYQEQYTPIKGSDPEQLQTDLQQLGEATGYFETDVRQFQQNYGAATASNMLNTRQLLDANYRSEHLPEQQQQELTAIQTQLWPNYRAAQDRLLSAISAQAPLGQSKNLLAEANADDTLLQAQWNKVSNSTENIGEKIASIGESRTNPLLLITLIAFLGTVIIVTSIGYIIYRTITVPLHHLARLTKRIGRGETTARAMINGNDEIYLVANSMNNMLDNIVHLIQEAQEQRDILQGQIEKLVSEVSGVGEGDLRVQAELTSDAMGVLADSFNYMVEELGSLVVRVKSVSHEVENSTEMILDRMTQLVNNEQQQIEGISEATIKIEQMSQRNRQVAERTQMLYDVARVARLDAHVGRESVAQAIAEMNRITENVHSTANKVHNLGEHSREIDEIVEVISGMAQQTNRLALDAAIQAAMAGENGKGFGAVAADIRRLAERSKDQALLIARIVRTVREEIAVAAISMQDTQRETFTGARLTQEAGVALESLFAAVEHQAHEIEYMNQLANQQLQSSNHAVQIMQRTSETTHQNSYNTQEATQHMERLAHLVEQLRTSVEAFKLREDQQYQMPHSSMLINIHNETEKPLTISGVFRTISAPLQPISAPLQPIEQSIRYQSTAGDNFASSPPPATANDYISYTPMPVPAQTDSVQNPDWDTIPASEIKPEKWSTAIRPSNR